MLYILRNNKSYGPYTSNEIVELVNAGKILKCDRAKIFGSMEEITVKEYLSSQNLSTNIKQYGNIINQIKLIGSDLILPFRFIKKDIWTTNKRFLALAIIGLYPIFLTCLPFLDNILFYFISLYFSLLWGAFFYYFFNTSQVNSKIAAGIFFFTQIAIFFIWMLGLPSLNPFYLFVKNDNILYRLCGYILGVGCTEEFVKSISIYWILHFTKRPLIPRTVVFYGLISGIAFGVYEGVEYQIMVNNTMQYDQAYIHNILRITSLPFLHAVWTGIAGYFLSFSVLFPKFKNCMCVLALLIPAILHGFYDTFCGSLLIIPICIFSVAFLVTYLKNDKKIQSILSNNL